MIVILLIILILSLYYLFFKLIKIHEHYIVPPTNSLNNLIYENNIKNINKNVKKYAILADKYKVKKIIKNLKIKDLYIPKTYQLLKNCNDINFSILPKNYIIKPTHWSGISHKNKNNLETINYCKQKIQPILKKSYNDGLFNFLHNIIPIKEHHYDYIEPNIIIEEIIENNNDWKFYILNGKVKIVTIMKNRRGHLFDLYCVDKNFNEIPIQRFCKKITKLNFSKPEQWNKMINISEFIATSFVQNEFIRVDLYLSNNKIYFSELTFTPEGGRARIEPIEYDNYLKFS